MDDDVSSGKRCENGDRLGKLSVFSVSLWFEIALENRNAHATTRPGSYRLASA
jgi:hypothetical protein